MSLKREFAFPLGEVAAAVLAAHPAAADLLVAKMHQVCHGLQAMLAGFDRAFMIL